LHEQRKQQCAITVLIYFTALVKTREVFSRNNLVLVSWGRLASVKNTAHRFHALSIALKNAVKVANKTMRFIRFAIGIGMVNRIEDIHLIGIGVSAGIGGFK
jgi:hypothetical protein